MNNTVKKFAFIIFLLTSSSFVFGQQFLWSTEANAKGKKVTLNNVPTEVLEFYDQYDLYYDFTGYSKERFLEEVDFGFDNWEWIKKVNEKTVYAYKSNTGKGSVILVICVSKENVDMVIFSNGRIPADLNVTSPYERSQFSKWFKTLLK